MCTNNRRVTTISTHQHRHHYNIHASLYYFNEPKDYAWLCQCQYVFTHNIRVHVWCSYTKIAWWADNGSQVLLKSANIPTMNSPKWNAESFSSFGVYKYMNDENFIPNPGQKRISSFLGLGCFIYVYTYIMPDIEIDQNNMPHLPQITSMWILCKCWHKLTDSLKVPVCLFNMDIGHIN